MKKETVSWTIISRMRKSRDEFADKRAFGHALLAVGSKGMMGAAVLSAGAALKSGCGLVTAHIPEGERMIMHVSNPSAIVDCDPGETFTSMDRELGHYTAVGVGCGIGTSGEAAAALESLMESLSSMPDSRRPGLVLDADALNIIASRPYLFRLVPSGSILTPHTRELSRLMDGMFGDRALAGLPLVRCLDFAGWKYPWDGPEMDYLMALADRLSSVIVVKGHATLICPPVQQASDGATTISTAPISAASALSGDAERTVYVNSTGNPGMAKGGSGDVLTGLVTGLRARGYSALEASLLGVWCHGEAGDTASKKYGQESMNASDILECIHVI